MSTKRLSSLLFKSILALLFFTSTAQAASFVVTNLSRYDSWQVPVAGSLRKALEDAAAAGVGPHTITFDFTALGANPVFTFTGDEYLNNISTFALNGTNVTLDGLTGRPVGGSVTFSSAPYAGSTSAPGNAVFVMKGTSNTIKGITITSTAAAFTYTMGLIVTGTGHTVTQNNFINGSGVGLRLTGTTNAVVKNNLVENNGAGGILIDGVSTGALIGGCTVGDGNTIIRNGNATFDLGHDDEGNGITLGGQFLSCTATVGSPLKIQGNYIGTTSSFNFQDGSSNFLGNSHHGISVWQATNVTIGGTCPNYVANNGFRRIASGITIYASDGILIDGNIVGTDGVTGKKIGNNFDGITINAARNNTITNNIIGNCINGIAIRNSIGSPGVTPTGNIISNNKIGVDNVGNFIGASSAGISIEGNATTTLIQSNTIKSIGTTFSYGNGKTNPATNSGIGIFIQGTAGNQSHSVFLNTIGRQSADGASANNVGNAILITGSTDNLIGDLAKGNIIGSNGTTSDIVVDGASAIRNKITYNQFVCNGSYATKGIELKNTGNVDFGKPALVTVDMSSSGTITGDAPANSTVHVYSRASNCNQCLTSTTGNFSRGNTLLGIVTATVAGKWSFVTGQPATNIVVTATNASNNTSEFSYCVTPLTVCPTIINAGPDQTICNATTATLAALTPDGGGVGAWTTVTGTGTATTPASISSGLTGLTVGASTTFRWTVTAASCPTLSDDVIITISALPSSNAGSAQSVCNATTANLAATNPALGTGAWTTLSGTGVASSPNSNTSNVTGLTVGAASVFTWTVTNGACIVTSTVTVTSSSPVTSNAGSAFSVCNATTATLAATAPSLGTGTWTTTSGTGTATSVNSATSGVTGLTVGASSTFQWTVVNGACNANTSVIVTSSAPVTSNAGSAFSVCNATTATLAATAPGVGTGTWTTTSGTGTATSVNSATSGVTGLTVGASSTFTWTVVNGACNANTSVIVTASPALTANAGTAFSVCNATTATLSATSPSGGTGTWTTTSGTGTATSINSPTSGVTGLTVGATSTFLWTVSNGICADATSSVTISSSTLAVADEGVDQALCDITTTNMTGTGTGTWSVVSGTAVIAAGQLNNPTASVTGLTIGGTSVLKWTVANGACPASADVTIDVMAPALLNAGSSLITCSNSFTLSALDPGNGYTGAWTSSNPSLVFTPANDPNAVVTGFTSGANVLTWTVTGSGACSGTSSASITITFGSSDLSVILEAPKDTLCVGTPRTLRAIASGGSGNYAYVWVSKLNLTNPVIDFTVTIDTTKSNIYTTTPTQPKSLYWLILVDRTNSGCITPLEADTIYAVNGQDLNVPNLITPNEDGSNDYWVLRDKNTGQDLLPGTDFHLYNRWGNRVFEMGSYDNRFKAEKISDGIYYYDLKSSCGGKEYKGWLQVLGNNKP